MKYELVVIGASLGGLNAVRAVLSALPQQFRLPVAVAQHRDASAGDSLRFVLQEASALPVHDAEDKERIVAGRVYLAPAGYHLLTEGDHFALSTEEPVSFAQPSIDVLFETAAESFGARLVGVVLTGTGGDGAVGLAMIRRHGGAVLIESPSSAYAKEMPEAAKKANPGTVELPLEQIGPYLVELSGRT